MAMLVVFSVTDPLGTHTMTKGSLITDWTLELPVPQDRLGRFSTELFERYQCSEKALVGALAEMYAAGGFDAREPALAKAGVKAVTETLYGHSFSASSISAINKPLDVGLQAFAERQLNGSYPSKCATRRREVWPASSSSSLTTARG